MVANKEHIMCDMLDRIKLGNYTPTSFIVIIVYVIFNFLGRIGSARTEILILNVWRNFKERFREIVTTAKEMVQGRKLRQGSGGKSRRIRGRCERGGWEEGGWSLPEGAHVRRPRAAPRWNDCGAQTARLLSRPALGFALYCGGTFREDGAFHAAPLPSLWCRTLCVSNSPLWPVAHAPHGSAGPTASDWRDGLSAPVLLLDRPLGDVAARPCACCTLLEVTFVVGEGARRSSRDTAGESFRFGSWARCLAVGLALAIAHGSKELVGEEEVADLFEWTTSSSRMLFVSPLIGVVLLLASDHVVGRFRFPKWPWLCSSLQAAFGTFAASDALRC